MAAASLLRLRLCFLTGASAAGTLASGSDSSGSKGDEGVVGSTLKADLGVLRPAVGCDLVCESKGKNCGNEKERNESRDGIV